MALSDRRKVVLIKVESAYNTDAVPGATDAALVLEEDLELQPLDAEYVERNLVRPYMGNSQQLVGSKWGRITCSIENAGFGSAGPASPLAGYDALLRSGGLQRAITPGTAVDYSPVSTGFESVTAYWYQDGTFHKLTGAVAENIRWRYEVGQIPRIVFDLVGIYNTPQDAALPTPNTTGWQTPLIVNADNTPGFALHGASPCLQSLEISLGNTVARRSLVNCTQRARMVDREPTGTITIEATTVAEKDWWTSIATAQLGALQLTHGLTAGNITELASGNVQLTNPRFEESDKIIMMSADLRLVANGAGNNDLTFTVK